MRRWWLLALACLTTTGCTTYQVVSREYSFASLNYARPAPGKFKYVQRDLKVTVDWDTDDSSSPRGSEAYVARMSTMLVEATKQILVKAALKDNQALYNVRVSAPQVNDAYFAFLILTATSWVETHAQVSIAADVIEFTN
jgi:hypothetical protein